eukprot:333158-Chlamydomonas_euryale.AAC.9
MGTIVSAKPTQLCGTACVAFAQVWDREADAIVPCTEATCPFGEPLRGVPDGAAPGPRVNRPAFSYFAFADVRQNTATSTPSQAGAVVALVLGFQRAGVSFLQARQHSLDYIDARVRGARNGDGAAAPALADAVLPALEGLRTPIGYDPDDWAEYSAAAYRAYRSANVAPDLVVPFAPAYRAVLEAAASDLAARRTGGTAPRYGGPPPGWAMPDGEAEAAAAVAARTQAGMLT